jgi:uncharacterized protein (DUF2147 family)
MRRRRFLVSLTAAALALLLSPARADDASPVGLWKTFDDHTGKPESLIRITESHGELRGRIEKLFLEPGEDPNPACDKCEDTRKNQPILGMTILTGMKKEGNEFTGGRILDPASGNTYRSKMRLSEDGRRLHVHGYIGMPVFGRTQTWQRVD